MLHIKETIALGGLGQIDPANQTTQPPVNQDQQPSKQDVEGNAAINQTFTKLRTALNKIKPGLASRLEQRDPKMIPDPKDPKSEEKHPALIISFQLGSQVKDEFAIFHDASGFKVLANMSGTKALQALGRKSLSRQRATKQGSERFGTNPSRVKLSMLYNNDHVDLGGKASQAGTFQAIPATARTRDDLYKLLIGLIAWSLSETGVIDEDDQQTANAPKPEPKTGNSPIPESVDLEEAITKSKKRPSSAINPLVNRIINSKELRPRKTLMRNKADSEKYIEITDPESGKTFTARLLVFKKGQREIRVAIFKNNDNFYRAVIKISGLGMRPFGLHNIAQSVATKSARQEFGDNRLRASQKFGKDDDFKPDVDDQGNDQDDDSKPKVGKSITRNIKSPTAEGLIDPVIQEILKALSGKLEESVCNYGNHLATSTCSRMQSMMLQDWPPSSTIGAMAMVYT
jgi:hypothetical protein